MTAQNPYKTDNLDKNSPIPMYYQIQKIILDKIERGIWPPKTQIPPERELTELFKVSRMTLRAALAELTRSGILVREVGRGTYVAEQRITQGLKSLTGFSDDMRARGKQPGARVINVSIETVSPKLAEQFKVDLHTQVVVIERLRLADQEPMSLEKSYIHFPGCESLLQDDLTGSLYSLFISKYQIYPTKAHQQMTAGLSDRRQSDQLGIKIKSPVLQLSRLTTDQNNRIFEFVESVYRGDKYIFDAELMINDQS